MKHFSLEQWGQYIREELSDEERSAYELHLSSCDLCLDLYMQSVERAAAIYPVLDNEAGMADAVMERIADEAIQLQPYTPKAVPLKEKQSASLFVRSPIFQYAVAAAITLILMSSGVFQSITEPFVNQEATIDTASQQQEERGQASTERSSVSHKIMEKTIVMLDSIQPKHEKGGAR